jgi:ribosomal protein S18 acetylase RimI-like enzyme
VNEVRLVNGEELEPLSQEQAHAIAGCAYSAMPAFLDLYLGGPDALEEALASWWLREDSAFSSRLCQVALGREGEVLGCCFSMPVAELAQRQQADFMARMRSSDRTERQRLSRLFAQMSGDAPRLDPQADYLLAVGVLPLAQGQGVGAALILDFIDRAAQRGASGCELTVDKTNEKAGRLYRSLGFKPFGEAYNPVTDVHVDMLRRAPAPLPPSRSSHSAN